MKNEGISILQMVITIVIIIILATLTIFYGYGIPKEARIAQIYSETKDVESVFKEGYLLGEIKMSGDVLDLYGEMTIEKESNLASYSNALGSGASGDFYRLNFTTSKELQEVLELENVSNDYLLDFNNLNIYMIKGIELLNGNSRVMVYNSDDIEAYYNNTFKK